MPSSKGWPMSYTGAGECYDDVAGFAFAGAPCDSLDQNLFAFAPPVFLAVCTAPLLDEVAPDDRKVVEQPGSKDHHGGDVQIHAEAVTEKSQRSGVDLYI